MSAITKAEVENIQKVWGDGIVRIGQAFTEKANYEQVAIEHINQLYAYEQGPVLFKPTKAAKEQFRPDFAQALSYFVATNKACAEDGGFAIQPWTKVRFENHDILLFDANAIAMGNYYFTDLDGQETKVEYTFGYIKDSENQLRICVHHSAIPYQG